MFIYDLFICEESCFLSRCTRMYSYRTLFCSGIQVVTGNSSRFFQSCLCELDKSGVKLALFVWYISYTGERGVFYSKCIKIKDFSLL